jgi:hypothetical protein
MGLPPNTGRQHRKQRRGEGLPSRTKMLSSRLTPKKALKEEKASIAWPVS